MPVTLPAHAAAVLPFVGRFRFHATALVVGAASPDLAYLAEIGKNAHTLPGIFYFCLPVGLLGVIWAEALMLPALRSSLPDLFGANLARLLRSGGLPSSPKDWALAACAVTLGAVTHVLWDGFTHKGMTPAELYQDVRFGLFGFSMTAPRWAQHLSTLFGTAVVFAYLARRYRLEAPAPPGRWSAFFTLAIPTLVFAVLGLLWRLREPVWGGNLYTKVWKLFWPSAGFGLLAFSVACLLVLGLERRRGPTR